MPKHSRSASNSHNRYSNPLPTSLAPSPMYNQPRMTMPNNYYAVASSSSMPMQPQTQQPQPQQSHHRQQQQQQAYESYIDPIPPVSIPPPVQHRASSGAWTPHDDQQLLQARMQGLNWSQIQMTYFPGKTPNACRKRHERLMERKGADDWDTRKMQHLAKEYMGMRKEIWGELAARTGEKWNIVEQKCMSQGLKNLQSAARAASRRDRLESGAFSGYDDDSGISGIALTPVDELDASYSSPETTSSGAHSASSSASYQHLQPQMHLGAGAYGMGPFAGGYPSHGYSSSVSSTTSNGHGYMHGGSGTSTSSSPYMPGQRLPSVDMGIGSIINRPNGSRC